MTREQWQRLVKILTVADVTEHCVVVLYLVDDDPDFRRRMYRVRNEAWDIYGSILHPDA